MGLDMYLTGEKYMFRDWDHPENDTKMDGFRIKEYKIELGYWRKHPNLHGYIVKNFANDVDECQEIHLNVPEMRKIIDAIKAKELPHTTGFFFGKSDGSEDEESIRIFENAIKWMLEDQETSHELRAVIYQASW